MSIKIMSRVWSSAPYAGDQLLILLAVADFANDEGFFFASKATLAAKCRCSSEYVRLSLRKFIADGVIEVTKQGWGRGHATEFRFLRAVDNPQIKPQLTWGLDEENPNYDPHKTPTPEAKTPTTLGYNSNNNNNYQQDCDFHNNPQPCRGCASEAKAGMCINCHKTDCECARVKP